MVNLWLSVYHPFLFSPQLNPITILQLANLHVILHHRIPTIKLVTQRPLHRPNPLNLTHPIKPSITQSKRVNPHG